MQPRLTYRGGRLEGMSVEGNEAANKIQAFMLTSVFSKNEDIVALYSVKNNSAELVYSFLNEILEYLTEAGYTVWSVISDNHRMNRAVFDKLRAAPDECFFNNPFNECQKIFVIRLRSLK